MDSTSNEGRLKLAIKAIQGRDKLSTRQAAQIYNVPRSTLRGRINGKCFRQDTRANSMKMTELEEEAIVKYVLDLDSRGFSPQLRDVEDMANLLLSERDASRVGKHWASTFVKRQPELKTRVNRPYDYQRALCEDPDAIRAWFQLVANIRAKYGISDADFYNFDEAGFMMGMIQPSMVVTRAERRVRPKGVQPGNREWATVIQGVNATGWCIPPYILFKGAHHLADWYSETNLPPSWVLKTTENGWTDNKTGLDWIQHFDKHTTTRRNGRYRMLVIDGHGSHLSAEFNRFCKERDIITLCMPSHSSHLLQPLDVGCFSPLKRAYSRQIEVLMKSHINHVTKVDFLIGFKEAFFASLTEENIKAGFRGAGLVPIDQEVVLSKLDIRLRTPSPLGSPSADPTPWVSQTPSNPIEATSQSEFIKGRIAHHQSSSPTPIFSAMDQMAKGTQAIMHSMTLLTAEVHSLRKANKELSRRRRAKKTHVRLGGSLSVQDGLAEIDQKDADVQLEQEMREYSGRKKRVETGRRCCSKCGKPGHNARTCQEDREMSNVHRSE